MATSEAPKPPELEDQLEQLLHTVWDSERRQRMNDRIDQTIANDERRKKAKRRKKPKA
jgi:hypothetical protein